MQPRDAWAAAFAVCDPQGPFSGPLSAFPGVPRAKTPFVIVDIDGTVANSDARMSLHPKNRPGYPSGRAWDEFYAAAKDDPSHPEIVALALALAVRFPLFFLTGRREEDRAATRAWLEAHDLPVTRLLMRPRGDRRPDFTVKAEMLAALRGEGFEPLFAIEDRAQVAAMFRAAGVRVLHVAEGNY